MLSIIFEVNEGGCIPGRLVLRRNRIPFIVTKELFQIVDFYGTLASRCLVRLTRNIQNRESLVVEPSLSITPGTNLLAFETEVGWVVRGWVGALVSLTAGSLPCSAIAVVVTFAYESFSRNALVARAITGALAATVGLMLVTAIQLLRPHLSKSRLVFPILIALLSFLAVWKLKVPPVLDLGLAALLGFVAPVRKS